MKWSKYLIALIILAATSFAQQHYEVSNWDHSVAMLYDQFQRKHLSFNYGAAQYKWGGWQRNAEHKTPGDYFCPPESQPRLIDESTRKNISQSYFNILVNPPDTTFIRELHWYSDTLTYKWLNITEIRSEFFLRFTDGKCVYVISGWWPNFIKIYKAFPGNSRISLDSLIMETNALLKSPLNIAKTKFSDISDGKYFLVESKSNDFMVRYYNIKAYISDLYLAYSKKRPPMFSPWYSIIEITYYLNKDFIP
jgi:hypothetical protein